jgi:signal transduction histidine kinase
MSLARKFIISFLLSIFFITFVNIVSFYAFYTSYLKQYFAEKVQARDEVTIDYINDVLEKQTIDDIDSIFTDTEIEFFELLENSDGKISLNEDKNVNIVINYLAKSWVASKYIEELIPTDNFWKVIEAIRNEGTPEYRFVNKLTQSIIITNIVAILIIIISLLIFIRKTILPIKEASENIRKLKIWKDFEEIEYHNQKDEIWILISSINTLNKKLNLQESIRSRLLADISHELKTPITSIQCYLEWISDGVIKLNQKNLNSITNEMTRLISLVNKIMAYEKSERKKLKLDKTVENVSELMKLLVETHKKKLKGNKQRIKITWDEGLDLEIDKNLFIQLTHNLIWNFLKYAGNKTLLKINITKNYIDFSDNWVWIKAGEVQFLTEKFYQGNIDKSGDIDSRWIWVWLSITSKIIESHGWRFEIKSDIWKWFSFKIYV